MQCAQCGLRYCCRTWQSANFAEHRGRCQAEARTRFADLISTTAEPEKCLRSSRAWSVRSGTSAGRCSLELLYYRASPANGTAALLVNFGTMPATLEIITIDRLMEEFNSRGHSAHARSPNVTSMLATRFVELPIVTLVENQPTLQINEFDLDHLEGAVSRDAARLGQPPVQMAAVLEPVAMAGWRAWASADPHMPAACPAAQIGGNRMYLRAGTWTRLSNE